MATLRDRWPIFISFSLPYFLTKPDGTAPGDPEALMSRLVLKDPRTNGFPGLPMPAGLKIRCPRPLSLWWPLRLPVWCR